MKLNDLRKMTIRQQVRVRFRLSGGLECIINEHGVGKVPQLSGPPEFNLEEEFSNASEFVLEPALAGAGHSKSSPKTVSRRELEQMAGSGVAASAEADHEE